MTNNRQKRNNSDFVLIIYQCTSYSIREKKKERKEIRF